MEERVMHERGRAAESQWALRRERASIDRLRAHERETRARARLSDVTGIRSPELLARMRALGFDAASAPLLFLAPVVGMAGADGGVSATEAETLRELARRGGLTHGDPAWSRLEEWLAQPPSGARLDALLDTLRDVLDALPVHQADELRGRMLIAAERVGRVSGGFFGLAAMSRSERRFLERIGRC